MLAVPSGASAPRASDTMHAPGPAGDSSHATHTTDRSGDVRLHVGIMAIDALTHVTPAYANRTFTEAQLVQPVAMLAGDWRGLTLSAALDGEGCTLRRGELNPRIFGEGYVDRRHPHTLVHEAMVAYTKPRFHARSETNWVAFSFAADKGSCRSAATTQ
jgi:hypothetical protein